MSLLGGGTQTKPTPPSVALRLQTSVAGKPVPIGAGQCRLPGNLVWYGFFLAKPVPRGGKSGGKGGGSGGAKDGAGSFTYSAWVAIGVCEGPVTNIPTFWNGAAQGVLSQFSLAPNFGSYAQEPWPELAARLPGQALAYRGLAYVDGLAIDLGASPSLPNFNFEIQFALTNAIPGFPDADPSLWIADILTNVNYGLDFPAAALGDFSTYQAMCLASGLIVSDAIINQVAANTYFKDLLDATNSEFVWSSGKLTIVPYGDVGSISGNGFSYAAPVTPLFALNDDDFLPNQGSAGSAAFSSSDPVIVVRKRRSDALNDIKVEFLDRYATSVDTDTGAIVSAPYNPAIAEASDEAAIITWGLRPGATKAMHFFAYSAAAVMAANLQLRRQSVIASYSFTLDQRYIVLDPMDLIEITDLGLGLLNKPVLIKEITENQDGSLSFLAEDYLGGTSAIPAYGHQGGAGYSANFNTPPPPINPPLIFEPTNKLARSPEVWVAVSGPAGWGGCDVWVSNDGNSYTQMARITGGARLGTLEAALPSVQAAANGATIDPSSSLVVDISESASNQLLSGSLADLLAANTLCYVDGEYLAYQTATFFATGLYDLTFLSRGLYPTNHVPVIAGHLAGTPFVRLDGQGVARVPYTADRIGQAIHLKFLSFNPFEGGEQNLAEVEPYTYVIQGTSFHSPPADVTALNTTYLGVFEYLTWVEVTDSRTIRYEVRKGAALAGAHSIGTFAHPPVQVQGDDRYWVLTYATAPDGTVAYGAAPPDISVQGSVLVANVIASFDEQALGWTGTFGGTAAVVAGDVVTSGAGDVLSIAGWLAVTDLLNLGGQASGSYEVAAGHEIDVGRAVACNVMISWQGLGQTIGQDILGIDQWLIATDILDYAATANTDIFPEIALSQDGVTWGPWQRYQAGAYSARKFKARVQLMTFEPQTQALLTALTWAIDVPDRVDHYLGLSLATAGTLVPFRPDGGTAVAFNGGPNGATDPIIQMTILNAASGDTAIVSGISQSSCTLRVVNAGSGVARTVNAVVEGY